MKKKKGLMIGGGALLAAGAVAAGTVLVINKLMVRTPKGVEVVKPFSISKYMGKWYEIARMDNFFEKDLNNCTAEYSMNDEGKIKVVYRGYNYKKEKIEEMEGKVQFADSVGEGKLKVSHCGLLYAAYNIINIDEDYNNALVMGKDNKQLWLLSRNPSMPEKTIEYFLQQAESYGCKTSNLVWTEHNMQKYAVSIIKNEQIE